MFTLRSLPRTNLKFQGFSTRFDLATVVVHLVWLALFLHVLWYVFRFGVRAPYQDEWYFTGVLASSELNWRWVWDLHSEHRYPTGKVLYWWLTTTTGDFRAGAILTAILNGAAALGMLWFARRLRGKNSFVDMLFPAVLLNWGQFENYLFGYQIVFSLTSTGMAIILAAMCGSTCHRARNGVVAGLALLVVMQGGGYGLVAVLPVATWLVVAAWFSREAPSSRRGVMLFLAVSSLAYLALVLSHFERSPGSASRTLVEHAMVFLQALGCGLGDGMATLGHPVPVLGFVVFAAYLLALLQLLAVFVRDPEERVRALGIAGVLAWSLVSALAIAMARDAGYAPRYAGPGAIGVCAILVTAILYWPSLRKRWLTGLAVLSAISIVLVNVPTARYVGQLRREHFKGFARDLAEGMPPRYLGAKYGDILFFPDRPLAPHLAPLAATRYRSFEDLRSDPKIREIPLNLQGETTYELWSGSPREVLGVRVRFTLQEALPMLTLTVKDSAGRVSAVYLRPGAGEHETHFAIGRSVTQLTLDPATPAPGMRVVQASLEVPSE